MKRMEIKDKLSIILKIIAILVGIAIAVITAVIAHNQDKEQKALTSYQNTLLSQISNLTNATAENTAQLVLLTEQLKEINNATQHNTALIAILDASINENTYLLIDINNQTSINTGLLVNISSATLSTTEQLYIISASNEEISIATEYNTELLVSISNLTLNTTEQLYIISILNEEINNATEQNTQLLVEISNTTLSEAVSIDTNTFYTKINFFENINDPTYYNQKDYNCFVTLFVRTDTYIGAGPFYTTEYQPYSISISSKLTKTGDYIWDCNGRGNGGNACLNSTFSVGPFCDLYSTETINLEYGGSPHTTENYLISQNGTHVMVSHLGTSNGAEPSCDCSNRALSLSAYQSGITRVIYSCGQWTVYCPSIIV